jgi:NADPH-dependent ferric siderophore reductase
VSEVPRIERVRHELKRRQLTVARVVRYAPQMVRVVLTGNDLEGFTSLGFDDHVKLFFDGAMRDFTPRRYDAEARELWIDFFLHEAGPAATWASQVTPGQTLEVGGPKGSAVISLDGIDTHFFIGDETAVPAIGRRLEELPASASAIVVIEADVETEWPRFESRADVATIWVPRDRQPGEPAHDLIEMLGTLEFPDGNSFFWVAVESRAARAIRRYLREQRGIDKDWIKAAGYWQRGAAGAHETISGDE